MERPRGICPVASRPVKVVVTGGAGFIGANLCAHLGQLDEISEVVAFDDLSTGFRENLVGAPAKVRFVEGSVLDSDAVRAAAEDADAIVHLAARPSVPRSLENPILSHHVNVDGTLNILEYARHADKTPHIVFASSSSVYGANLELPKHEGMATLPRSPYAASKLAGEAYVLAYRDSFGVPALPFRFFNVYGPLQAPGHAYAAVVPAFFYAALHGEPVSIHGDGSQTRDFTHVDTVACVIAEAILGKVTSGSGVNLAFGTRYSLLDVLSIMEELLGHPIERVHGPSRAGDVHDSQAACTLLMSLFPQVSPLLLRAGLTSTLEWMRTLA
jgi:UDP-glucose 4-epimerase